jgi:hypothetical protein
MTVFNLTAQLNHPEAPALYKDCFCYDEPSLGITAEPLIHITTAAIQKLLSPAQPQEIQLTFSTEHQPEWRGVVTELTYVEGDADGSAYEVTPVGSSTTRPLPVWLCPRLMDYFSEPPQTFFCSISC